MRILFLIDCLGSGGAQRQMVGLAQQLQENGYSVKIIYYHPVNFYRSYLDKYHIPNEFIAGSESKIKRIFLIAQAIRIFVPEVLISYLDVPNIIACLLRTIGMKYRLITSERNTSQSLNGVERLKYLFLRKADAIVPNSYSQERFIKRHFPRLCQKIHTIINFVDLETFSPASDKKRGWGAVKIVGMGRIEAQKNITCLIKATKIVIDQGQDIRVDWYGRKTCLIKEYERMIEEMNIDSVFSFHEPEQDIHLKYQEADLFILPSFYEGCPNVLCEAMACGLPVICSDVCDNPSIMENGVNGYLFDPHDSQGLADVIINYIVRSQDEKEQMGRKSRELAEKKFEKKVFVDKYLELIQ